MSSGFKTKDLTAISFSAAFICVCTWISVPTPVPFTLQTLGIFLISQLVGGRLGTVSVLIYILLGCVGLPVFSGFSGGVGVLFGPTGGYITGFVFSSLIMWAINHFFGNSLKICIVSMLAALTVCYIFGSIWYMAGYLKSVSVAALGVTLTKCVLPFIIPDIIKIAVAVFITEKFTKKY